MTGCDEGVVRENDRAPRLARVWAIREKFPLFFGGEKAFFFLNKGFDLDAHRRVSSRREKKGGSWGDRGRAGRRGRSRVGKRGRGGKNEDSEAMVSKSDAPAGAAPNNPPAALLAGAGVAKALPPPPPPKPPKLGVAGAPNIFCDEL